jgi:Inner membrane component of T3SS, cytoplasmic domain
MAYLHFITGPLAGKRAHLKAARITIGRARGNAIRIDEPTISPRHLVLLRDGDDYLAEIDGSRPPVALNGTQIVKARLNDGDKLQIGAVQVAFHNHTEAQPEYNPLDFYADVPPPPTQPLSALPDAKPKAAEVLSLDDAGEVRQRTARMHARSNKTKRVLFAVGLLALMLGGSLLLFRKDFWKKADRPAPAAVVEKKEPDQPAKIDHEPPKDKDKENEKPPDKEKKDEPAIKVEPMKPPPIGIGESGLRAGAKIHRTRTFKSHQEAVDAAEPGDSVIFDSADAKPIVVHKPIRDVQFLSGSASWELHADLIDCQFLFHETKQFEQMAGRMERCVFFRCPMKRTHLIHADAVSMYFDERSPLHPTFNPDQGRTPTLLLTGFVRNVLIHRPQSGSATADKRFDMNWAPAIRIHATDIEGDGRGTYILNPIVLGQRAWTPHQIVRGNSVTYAHLTADHSSWADPVLEAARANDLGILSCSFGSAVPTAVEQYSLPPKKLKYHDRDEWGHDAPGPAFRGAAMTVTGYRTRVIAHGDARSPWTVARKMTIPGLHYADGIVVVDPRPRQFATEQGGLSLNLAEPKHLFVMQPADKGAEFLSSLEQPDRTPKYPLDGPEIYPPTFVPLKDLRINAGEFDKMPLADMTGKPTVEIEKMLVADRSLYLGPGTYEFKQTLRAGFVVGAGMDKTILKWPGDVDCAQRNCRGLINCTVSGGRFGYNSQAGAGGKSGNPNGLFLRTRFSNQKEAGVNLHTVQFMTWQDCEFNGGRAGFTHLRDKDAAVYKGDKGAAGGVTIDNLNICNCSFRNLKHRGIDLSPDSPKLGHIGIHNCSFEDIGETALRIDGGQTHLIQLCKFVRCASQTYVPALHVVSHGTLALSHVDVDCSGVKGNPLAVSLKGLTALSRCTIRGLPTALQCDSLLAADRVTADGNLKAPKDSLLFHCRFKNMDLPDGVAIAKEDGFADVTPQCVAAPSDKSPPPEVAGFKVRTINKQRRLEWEAVDDPESGIAGYIILADGKEIGRTPLQYEPPSDIHSPVLRTPIALQFTDPNLNNKGYLVVAVNGVGLMSDGREATPRRFGPARAKFLTAARDEIRIRDFVNVKGKVTQVIDEEGNRLPLAKVGINGAPNIVYFEWGTIAEAP